MEDNKRKDDNLFYRSGGAANGDGKEQGDSSKPSAESGQSSSSFYYSYGPYKSNGENENGSRYTTYSTSNGEAASADVSAPRPVRPYASSQVHVSPTQSEAKWEYGPPKKRTGWKSMFAAFMAGAVLVGGLMVTSDRLNLFTPKQAVQSAAAGTGSTLVSSSGGGGVTTAVASTARPNSIADLVDQASPAVVKIDTYVKSSSSSSRSRSSNPFFNNDDIYRYFFGNGGQLPDSGNSGGSGGQQSQRQQAGVGSGFIFDKSGYILTNQHVLEGADEVEVEVLGFKEPFKAEVLGTSRDLDLAVIKITGDQDFSVLPIGDSDQLRVGDWVTAIGNPMGFDHTVSVGVLSAKEREITISQSNQQARKYQHLLQTDASINPGNSGGPLINMNGEVIGINTAVSSEAQGIGFAISTGTIKSVLDNLKNNVKVPSPFIGVRIQDIPSDWTKQLKVDSTDGVVVISVVTGSPAARADLQPYDVVTQINGEKVKNAEEFTAKIKTLKVGDKATLTVVREGQSLTTAVTVGDQNK
ncbi:S1C family serine protease [Paenibacillus sp. y28]|uniref:S1C family serine protease n=1 Tax=Paenibacillus sp. y28 TaxID=3129110 RepID=UPI003019DC74